MFERIVIKEVHKDCGERMRILFDISSQKTSRLVQCNHLKLVTKLEDYSDRSHTPMSLNTKLSFTPKRSAVRTHSNPSGDLQSMKKKLIKAKAYFNDKRNITEELLMGIDNEVQTIKRFRIGTPSKLKFIPNIKRLKFTSFHKIGELDGTVPESIIIKSKSPIVR